jgi:hypothetical protein
MKNHNNAKTSKSNKNVRNNIMLITITRFAYIFPQKNLNMQEEKKIQRTIAPVMSRPRTPRRTPQNGGY